MKKEPTEDNTVPNDSDVEFQNIARELFGEVGQYQVLPVEAYGEKHEL